MTRILADGVRYEVRTGGSGPGVLLLHGFTGRGADWGALLPALRRSSTTVVVDLLGHGRSDAPSDPARHAVERQAADIASVLRRSRTAPAAVVGYSFGARVALALAVTQPDVVRALVLESPSAGIADAAARATRRAADDALADRIERDGIEAFVDTVGDRARVRVRGRPSRRDPGPVARRPAAQSTRKAWRGRCAALARGP